MWNNQSTHIFHVGAWCAWLAAAMLAALLTRNPFYLLLVIAVSITVNRSITRGTDIAEQYAIRNTQYAIRNRGTGLLLRTVVGLALTVAILKGLSYHIGATILFTLPESWPVLGGPVTLEGMTSAGLDALSILAVLSVFTAFSAEADYYALLRSVPPFMHQVALVTSIAITFVPQTITRFGEIREAQALRGHRVRRIGDLIPLIIPLLAGGMERSMNLAEAMEARGFSRTSATERRVPPIVVQLGLAGGLGLVLAGGAFFALLPAAPWLSWLLIGTGVLLIVATLRAVGAGVRRSRYRRTIWRDRDTPLLVVSLGIMAILLTFRFIAPSILVYDPFLRISMPKFEPVVALTILALLAPVVIVNVVGTQYMTPLQSNKQKATQNDTHKHADNIP